MPVELSTEPDYFRWIDGQSSYACAIRRHPQLQHLCGYLGLPAGHPWHGKDYDHCQMIDGEWAEVHGGLTYAADHEPGEKPDGLWWIGFDCAHAGDWSPGLDRAPRNYGDDYRETYKDFKYVTRELEELAAQALRHARAMETGP